MTCHVSDIHVMIITIMYTFCGTSHYRDPVSDFHALFLLSLPSSDRLGMFIFLQRG